MVDPSYIMMRDMNQGGKESQEGREKAARENAQHLSLTSHQSTRGQHHRERKTEGHERVRNVFILKTDQSKLTKVLRRLRVGNAQTLHLYYKLH